VETGQKNKSRALARLPPILATGNNTSIASRTQRSSGKTQTGTSISFASDSRQARPLIAITVARTAMTATIPQPTCATLSTTEVRRAAAINQTVTATPIEKATNGRSLRIIVPCGGMFVLSEIKQPVVSWWVLAGLTAHPHQRLAEILA